MELYCGAGEKGEGEEMLFQRPRAHCLFLVASLTKGLWTRRTSGQVSALPAFANLHAL